MAPHADAVGVGRGVGDDRGQAVEHVDDCLLYTSDAADERSSVDLGGRRIIKKKKSTKARRDACRETKNNSATD